MDDSSTNNSSSNSNNVDMNNNSNHTTTSSSAQEPMQGVITNSEGTKGPHEPSHHKFSEPPRGILRNVSDSGRDGGDGEDDQQQQHQQQQQSSSQSGQNQKESVTWDQEWLAQDEERRNRERQENPRIEEFEPKTPWPEKVDLDGLADIDEITPLNLSSTSLNNSPHSSRHSSFSASSRRSSVSSSRRGSSSSEKRVTVSAAEAADAHDRALEDPEARAKHDQFKQKRKSHYQNAGQLMRMAKEQATFDSDDEDDDKTVPPVPPLNGNR